MIKASEMFWDSFIDGGSIVADCACGRVHFSRCETNDWENGELEELLKNEEKSPDKYIGTNDDSVAVAMISGVGFCYNCPCNGAARYENFIFDHESEIIKYYGTQKHGLIR